MFKKMLCILLCAATLCVFSSCDSNNVFSNSDYMKKDGEICISPYFAYYNDGKIVPGLENLDSEKGAKATDDGSFCIYLAISNSMNCDKKLTNVTIHYIRDENGNDIVDECDFPIDNATYIDRGSYRLVECLFGEELVLMKTRLSSIEVNASADIEGCVTAGEEPQKADSGFTVSVMKALFTETDSIEGKIAIRNNDSTDRSVKTITFSLETESGKKISKKESVMVLDTTIGSGEILTKSFAVNQSNITNEIKKDKQFNSIVVKFEIK